jgi:hypothetical protein
MARTRAIRAESIWAALGGVLAGYVLWLIAISIGDFLTTAGLWGPIVLAGAVGTGGAVTGKPVPGGLRVRVAGAACAVVSVGAGRQLFVIDRVVQRNLQGRHCCG